MNRMRRILLPLLAAMMLSGCFMQSLQPFYSQQMVVQMPELSGKWLLVSAGNENVTKKYPEPWIFDQSTLRTFDKGVASLLNVVWFRIDDALFADFSASDSEQTTQLNAWWTMHSISVHSVCKVLIDKETLSLIPLDGEWISKAIDKREIPLSYALVGGKSDHYVLTSSSQELAAFLKKYRHSPEAFPMDNAHVLRRILPKE